MKDGVRLVNSARGALIDEAALVDGSIRQDCRAALDVFPKSRFPPTARSTAWKM